MVRICAALAWADETPEFLTRCVRSLEGVVDELMACDGAWNLYEGEAFSGPEQEEAIWDAARSVGIESRVFVPHGIWESQVAKRATLMEMAGQHADWVFVIDADEYVVYSEPETIRRALADTEALCAFVAWKNLNRGEQHMPGTNPKSGLNHRLFRAGTTVRTVHSGYFYEGCNVLIECESLDLRHCLAVEHDNINRGAERNERARSYRRLRHTTGVETWVKV